MQKKEIALVLGVIVVGLVPSYFVYGFVSANPIIPSQAGDGISHVQTETQGMGTRTHRLTVYESRPQKETGGSCANSFYMSYTLTLTDEGKLALAKHCESKRDAGVTWIGMATTTWSVATGTSPAETRGYEIQGTILGEYKVHRYLWLSRSEDRVEIVRSDIREVATSTILTIVPTPNP